MRRRGEREERNINKPRREGRRGRGEDPGAGPFPRSRARSGFAALRCRPRFATVVLPRRSPPIYCSRETFLSLMLRRARRKGFQATPRERPRSAGTPSASIAHLASPRREGRNRERDSRSYTPTRAHAPWAGVSRSRYLRRHLSFSFLFSFGLFVLYFYFFL